MDITGLTTYHIASFPGYSEWPGNEATHSYTNSTYLLMASQPLMRYFTELGRNVGDGMEVKALRKSGIRWSRNTCQEEQTPIGYYW